MSNIKVLYVDDEQQNLNSFRAAFRSRYKIYTAISVSVAFEILNQEDINVIISDQRMPEITGVEFFRITKTRYPNIPRILLTGYTDIEVLADAVNHGDVYRYITKPWDELELHNSVLNAYDYYVANQSLQQKIFELQKANDELNRFIYSLSHELRAPLASAIGIIDLVKIEDKFGTSGEYWKLMETCTNKLDYYISKTLEYYKTARFKVENKAVNFKELIDPLIDLYKNENDGQNINFEIQIDERCPYHGDSFRLEIIIANLLSNAVKCQRQDEPNKKVAVHIVTSPENATIVVSDNGSGIEKENLDKIFDQFFKGVKLNGSGLGLYIVKESIDKLEGTIYVESEPGSGSGFTVVIPNLTENKQP